MAIFSDSNDDDLYKYAMEQLGIDLVDTDSSKPPSKSVSKQVSMPALRQETASPSESDRGRREKHRRRHRHHHRRRRRNNGKRSGKSRRRDSAERSRSSRSRSLSNDDCDSASAKDRRSRDYDCEAEDATSSGGLRREPSPSVDRDDSLDRGDLVITPTSDAAVIEAGFENATDNGDNDTEKEEGEIEDAEQGQGQVCGVKVAKDKAPNVSGTHVACL